MRYQFTGTAETVFPSILATRDVDGVPVTGSLVCQPGEVIDIDASVSHGLLAPFDGHAAEVVQATHAAVVENHDDNGARGGVVSVALGGSGGGGIVITSTPPDPIAPPAAETPEV